MNKNFYLKVYEYTYNSLTGWGYEYMVAEFYDMSELANYIEKMISIRSKQDYCSDEGYFLDIGEGWKLTDISIFFITSQEDNIKNYVWAVEREYEDCCRGVVFELKTIYTNFEEAYTNHKNEMNYIRIRKVRIN